MTANKCSRPGEQGATALEFALIFPLLFALLYGVIVYAYVWVLQESMTFAAQQGATAAIQVDPAEREPGVYRDLVEQRARQRAASSLNWLPNRESLLGAENENVEVSPRSDAAGTVVEVRLQIPITGIFPRVVLPLIGEFPPLPENLSSSASVLVGEAVVE